MHRLYADPDNRRHGLCQVGFLGRSGSGWDLPEPGTILSQFIVDVIQRVPRRPLRRHLPAARALGLQPTLGASALPLSGAPAGLVDSLESTGPGCCCRLPHPFRNFASGWPMKLPLYEPVVLDGVRADTRPTCAKSRIGGYMEVSRAKGGAALRPSGEGCAARRERVAVEVHAPRGDGARIYASSCLRTEWQYPLVIVNIRATRMCRRATLAGCPALRYAELFPSKTIATSARLDRCAPLAERCSLRAHITTQARGEKQ